MNKVTLLFFILMPAVTTIHAEENFTIKQFAEIELLITDDQGNPIPDASVYPISLRSKKRVSYSWLKNNFGVAPIRMRTNASGIVTIRYPKSFSRSSSEKKPTDLPENEITGISFAVSHENHIDIEHEVQVNQNMLVTIKMERGVKLRLTGILPDGSAIPKNLYPVVNFYDDKIYSGWKFSNKVLSSPAIQEGEVLFSLIHYPDRGKIHYSRVMQFHLSKNSNQFHVDLKPGVSVKGQLDSSVKRPVKNGAIFFRNYIALKDDVDLTPDKITMNSFITGRNDMVKIKSDGTFIIDSLPPNSRLELVCVCDGYVTQNRSIKSTNIKAFIKPQFYAIKNENINITLPMEQAGSCEVYVVDEIGTPVPDATVSFQPNVRLPVGTILFANSQEPSYFNLLLSQLNAPKHWIEFINETNNKEKQIYRYTKTTNQHGIAIIKYFPIYGSRNFIISCDNYITSDKNEVELINGQKSETIVILKKK